MLSQLPVPTAGSIENVLLALSALAAMALLGRKLLHRKGGEHGEWVRKSELLLELNGLRDRIDSRFLTLSEKIERVGDSLHRRLNELESGLARVDERTRSGRKANR